MANGVTVSNVATASQQDIIDSLTEQLAKANERENRLEKILQRYESEQLQPLKLRVKELEQVNLELSSLKEHKHDAYYAERNWDELNGGES